MNNYSVVANTEKKKSQIIDIINASGAVVSAISGYFEGYYIQLNATDAQAIQITKQLQNIEE